MIVTKKGVSDERNKLQKQPATSNQQPATSNHKFLASSCEMLIHDSSDSGSRHRPSGNTSHKSTNNNNYNTTKNTTNNNNATSSSKTNNTTGRQQQQQHQRQQPLLLIKLLPSVLGFVLGCIISGTVVLHLSIPSSPQVPLMMMNLQPQQPLLLGHQQQPFPTAMASSDAVLGNRNLSPSSSSSSSGQQPQGILAGVRVLVVLVAFDFSQLPHLEEVLDSYYDVAVTGAMVHVVIHTTVAYPIPLIDMWNDRFQLASSTPVVRSSSSSNTGANNGVNNNNNYYGNNVHFQITIAIKPSKLRLHLVDCHRKVFYEHLNDYDLFIYSEDDIRVTPTTVAAYWIETRRVESLLLLNEQENNNVNHKKYNPWDFNVGIVRYEYNYPSNVVIDDNTRHATQNVTRVYWEHSRVTRPNIFPDAVMTLAQEQEQAKLLLRPGREPPPPPPAAIAREYVTMKNHHQGMYLATPSLLQAWKERCRFDLTPNRPGSKKQPSEGTQRVWMSSYMLYGRAHCNVQQLLPVDRFGTLTVWHLPNKNYRRVGKYRNRTFADGSEIFEQPHASLLNAMELHLALKKVQYSSQMGSSSSSQQQQRPVFSAAAAGGIQQGQNNNLRGGGSGGGMREYQGVVRMIDEVGNSDRPKLLQRRLKDYQAYVRRGGILSDWDMAHTALIEQEEEVVVDNHDD